MVKVNGDATSRILFGTLLVLALGGTASIGVKRRRDFPEQWRTFAQAISGVAFGAIARGGTGGPRAGAIGA